MDPNSTISRMNLGRFYEQYIGASCRDTHKNLCRMFNVPTNVDQFKANTAVLNASEDLINNAYSYLLKFYSIVSPKMYSWFSEGKINNTKEEYLAEIISKGIGLFIPTDNTPDSQDIVLQLEKEYRPTYGPVTYIGDSGNKVTTKTPIRIGPVYFIMLEKIGDDWSAVSSCKLQHFGVPSQLTKVDKYSKPARQQAVRGNGEAEVRILVSYVGPEFVAETMDRNNNPKTHRAIVDKILTADQPTNIDNLVNRKELPYGGAKSLQLVNHILQVSGVEFKYSPYTYNPN